MPREERMFGDVADPSIRVGNHQGKAVALTVVVESILVAALVVVPLMATGVLPAPHEAIDAFTLQPTTPEPPPPPRPATPAEPSQSQVNPNAAPIEPPPALAAEPPQDFREAPADSFVGGADLTGVFGDPAGAGVIAAPPPAPPAATPVRAGSGIRTPQKTRHVAPVYPDIARSARVEGTVIIEATIGASGRVSNAHVLRGHPLLDAAALDAVRQWEFAPTLLNGVPVPVIMTVTVNFRLT